MRGSDRGEEVYKRTFIRDEENRLKSTVDNRYSVGYRYDYARKRTNKRSGNVKETLYYNSMWSEREDSPSFREMKNIYLGNKRIATRLGLSDRNSENYMEVNTYYHTNHLGSSSVVTDHEGEVYEEYEYTPYGETWIEKGNDILNKIPYRFNAKELDSETGLYYFGARYLKPATSRWISADPAGASLINQMKSGKPQQSYSMIEAVNCYSYTSNNPVRYTDPTGMESKELKSLLASLRDIEKSWNQLMSTIKYGGLAKQNNSRLNSNGSSACNFRAIQAAAEVHVGKKLTSGQINAATADLYESGAMRDDRNGSHFFVTDPTAVLNDALQRLGSDDIGQASNEYVTKSNIPANADSTIVRGETPNGNRHSQLGNSKGNPVGDPYHKDPVPLTDVKYTENVLVSGRWKIV